MFLACATGMICACWSIGRKGVFLAGVPGQICFEFAGPMHAAHDSSAAIISPATQELSAYGTYFV
jgi:hypothetical protein